MEPVEISANGFDVKTRSELFLELPQIPESVVNLLDLIITEDRSVLHEATHNHYELLELARNLGC